MGWGLAYGLGHYVHQTVIETSFYFLFPYDNCYCNNIYKSHILNLSGALGNVNQLIFLKS